MGKLITLIIVAVLVALAGCASPQGNVGDPRLIWCDQSSPRRDATPTTPRSELDQINAHNAKGVEWCGWSP